MEGTTHRLLVIAKTYPVPQKKQSTLETVCTGCISAEGKLYRLYPVPYRMLPREQQYDKFQWITVSLAKANEPHRPESHIPDTSSIRIASEVLRSVTARANVLRKGLTEALPKRPTDEGRSLCLTILLDPELRWVPNSQFARDAEVMKLNESVMFPDKHTRRAGKLRLMKKLLSVSWRDTLGAPHNHTLQEWQFYAYFDRMINEGRSEEESEELTLERSRSTLFNPGKTVWGLFGTMLKRPNTWILGSVFALPNRVANEVAEPRLFDL